MDDSTNSAARVAGLSYLLSTAAVVYANLGIFARLNVRGNSAESARNFVAHETLFRTTAVLDLAFCAGMLILFAALYVILAPVSRFWTLASTVLKAGYVFAWLLVPLTLFDALQLANPADYLRVIEPQRLQALMKLSLSTTGDRYYAGLIFYSVGSTISSYVWLKSAYIHKAFAAFGVISSAWCVFCTVVFLIVPSFADVVNLWWFDTPLALFDIALSVRLLFGIRRS